MAAMNILGANPIFTVSDIVYPHKTYGPRIQPNLELTFIFEGDIRVRIDGKDKF